MIIIKSIVFIWGIFLTVQLAAAFYGIVDYWYAIDKWYPKVVLRIIFWLFMVIGMASILSADYRLAFLCGIVSFCGFHIVFFLILRIIAARPVPRKKMK